MKRVTNKMVAEALLKLNARTRCPADKISVAELDMAYDRAREAVANPLPEVSGQRIRGVGPKRLGLPEHRYEGVLEASAELLRK